MATTADFSFHAGMELFESGLVDLEPAMPPLHPLRRSLSPMPTRRHPRHLSVEEGQEAEGVLGEDGEELALSRSLSYRGGIVGAAGRRGAATAEPAAAAAAGVAEQPGGPLGGDDSFSAVSAAAASAADGMPLFDDGVSSSTSEDVDDDVSAPPAPMTPATVNGSARSMGMGIMGALVAERRARGDAGGRGEMAESSRRRTIGGGGIDDRGVIAAAHTAGGMMQRGRSVSNVSSTDGAIGAGGSAVMGIEREQQQRSRRRGVSLGGGGGGGNGGFVRSGLSRKFVRSLIRHLNLRADSRQREDLRSMVETLKCVANQPGVDMKQELKREAVSLLGPELAREAFEASLSETRTEFLRQRTVAAASAAAAEAAAATTAIGGGQAAAAAAAAAAADAAASQQRGLSPVRGGAAAGATGGVSDESGDGRVGGVPLGVQGRARGAHPHPRKRKSAGGRRDSLDSNGEEVGGLVGGAAGSVPFHLMPPEDVEQRLKALHRGPAHQDFHLCCVCMDRPRDAAIIHGKTAHQAACYDCATELFEQGLPCPCCRQPIAFVVRNYL